MDPVIVDFLNERKDKWLKTKLKNVKSEPEKRELEKEADIKFSLGEWLPDAAKRAKTLSFATHPGKFSYPSSKITPIIAISNTIKNGYIHTGNVDNTEMDVYGSAGAMGVYKFLILKLSDNKTILEHLEEDTTTIKQELASITPYNKIVEDLLAIKQDSDPTIRTSAKISQVFFPVDDEYHLLSILTSSSILYELKKRINEFYFSDEAKEARKARRNNTPHEKDFSEIYDIHAVGYGGTKPQNISVLNNQNGGIAFTLQSMPPKIKSKTIRYPTKDFFYNSLWINSFENNFKKLHKLFAGARNNVRIRTQRDRIIQFIIYKIIDRVWEFRASKPNWSDAKKYNDLPLHQKILLDQKYESHREDKDNTDWFDSMKDDFSAWFTHTYKTIIGKDAVTLDRTESIHFETLLANLKGAL